MPGADASLAINSGMASKSLSPVISTSSPGSASIDSVTNVATRTLEY